MSEDEETDTKSESRWKQLAIIMAILAAIAIGLFIVAVSSWPARSADFDDYKAPPPLAAAPEYITVYIGTGEQYRVRLHRAVAKKYGLMEGDHSTYGVVEAAKNEEKGFLKTRLR